MTTHPPADDGSLDLVAQIARMRQVFDAQRATALHLRQSDAAGRLGKIRQLKQAVLAHRPAIIAAAFADFGKPAAEVELTEILPVIAEANHAIRALRGWMKPRRVWPSRMTLGTSSKIQYEPKGRVLIVAPWNYPVNLSLGPLVSALAAGNAVILKPSELTPHTTAVISAIIASVFTEQEVALFEGDAPVAQALLELPFEHFFFTGSPAVGKLVMAAAARHLCSVTLELGGKSPTIVDQTADLKAAAQNILWAKFTNNGQTCIAPDHVYVHASVKQAFLAHCRLALQAAYGPAQQQAASPDLARMVNPRHAQRVQDLLDDALACGAKAVTGGPSDPATRFIAPTLLEDVPAGARIMEEEIFGPLLPVIAYQQLDAVIAQINAQPKPLALYMWSRSETHIAQVMQQTSSGGACINHCVLQFVHGNLPFGGVNNSGIGNSHGRHGFLAFSHERAVVRSRVMLARIFYPPYTGLTRKLINCFIKMV